MHGQTTTLELEQVLRQLAARQLGLITRQQAFVLGVAERSLRYRIDEGALLRCHNGVYRFATDPKTFAQSCLAAALAAPDAAVTGRSAALLHGLPVGTSLVRPEIVLPHDSNFCGTGVTVRLAEQFVEHA